MKVLWAEQQRVHKRFKRDHFDVTSAAAVNRTNNINNYNNNNSDIFFDDPFWPQQWNLVVNLFFRFYSLLN